MIESNPLKSRISVRILAVEEFWKPGLGEQLFVLFKGPRADMTIPVHVQGTTTFTRQENHLPTLQAPVSAPCTEDPGLLCPGLLTPGTGFGPDETPRR